MANQPGAVNGVTALLMHIERPWAAVTDPERLPPSLSRTLIEMPILRQSSAVKFAVKVTKTPKLSLPVAGGALKVRM
jgi:hypothetical protein